MPNEESILSLRTHWATIIPRSVPAVVLLVVYATLLMPLVLRARGPVWSQGLLYAAIGVAGLRILVEALRVAGRWYTLSDVRITASGGILRRWRVEMPLASVQYVVLHRSIVERLLGLGTVGVSSAGGGVEVLWIGIEHPGRAMDLITAARDAARAEALHRARSEAPSAAPQPAGAPSQATAPVPPEGAPIGIGAGNRRPLIIGLAGAIGSGKSAVARALEAMGAVVSDSDTEAKALLQSPGVRATLVAWWGESVLAPDATVDRRAVADVIFKDPSQRARLEALIHPMLRAGRERLIDDATRRGVGIVVIDAPLLFEAGVDRECDEVWFIDAPREQRLARVKASRGWDEAELDRREGAQLQADEKRRRSTRVIVNDGDEGALIAQVRVALEKATADARNRRLGVT